MTLIKVPESKIVYSKEPEDAIAHTRRLDKVYSRFGKLYDLFVKWIPFWKTWIEVVLPFIDGPRVLEASFGTGYLLMQYAGHYETCGIDYNHTMIEIAGRNLARKGIQADLQWADVEQLPFPEDYFDTVINTMAFSGYPDGKKAMAEFHRVLKKDGKLLIVDFNYPADRNCLGYWFTKFMESVGDTIRDLPRIIQTFSFEQIEREVGGFGSVHFYMARKLGNGFSGKRME